LGIITLYDNTLLKKASLSITLIYKNVHYTGMSTQHNAAVNGLV